MVRNVTKANSLIINGLSAKTEMFSFSIGYRVVTDFTNAQS